MSFSVILPLLEEPNLREHVMQNSNMAGVRLQVRPDLSYPFVFGRMVEDTAVAGTDLSKLKDEISEELSDGEAVAVILETREPSKKMVDLDAKIVFYQNKIRDYKNAIVESLAKRTTKYTKCPTCGSSVSIPHIKGIDCPVCTSEELLMTNTHHKKLAGYQEYIDDYTQRYTEALEANHRAKVTQQSWLVVSK